MKTLFLLLLFSFSQAALADWSRVAETSHPEPQQYLDLDSVKQTGPMAIMRRVWELRNYSTPHHDKVRSIKRLSEYDCMDRRHRVVQELWFTDPWAKVRTCHRRCETMRSSRGAQLSLGASTR